MAINFLLKDGSTQQAVSGLDFRPFQFSNGTVDDNYVVAINSQNQNVMMVPASEIVYVLNTTL